jgi:excisionase family DNA binding protein
MSDRILYSIKDAAEQISVSVSVVEQLIVQGELKTTRIGKRILIARKELERLTSRQIDIVWPERKHQSESAAATA